MNSDIMQENNTGMMIRSVAELISFVFSRVRLVPDDIIATGTPEGVGAFQSIQLYSDDTVEIEVEGIGTLINAIGKQNANESV